VDSAVPSSLPSAAIPDRLLEAVQAVAAALQAALASGGPDGLRGEVFAGVAPPPRREAETLVLAALGLPRSLLFTEPQRPLSGAERARLAHWLARRCDGEPLAYLRGEREFWSLAFAVTPAVLVPRPETELLVERALQAGAALEAAGIASPTVLDLGTGSGAIAIALAHERPGWRVTAVERARPALEVARRNAARHAVRVELLHGDWFAPVQGRRFHLIVANPPYLAADDPRLAGDSLRHEPLQALTPGDDGFGALAVIAAAAPSQLDRAGWLLLEHGHTQGARLRAELVARGFAHVVSHRDLAGHERVTLGQR